MFLYIIVLVLAVVLLYTWIVYPLILRFVPIGSVTDKDSALDLQLPVAVVLSAYNEEDHLKDRLENLLAVEYPSKLIQVYVGLDGCSDNSAVIAKEFAALHENIDIHDFTERRGKVSVLKDLVSSATSDGGENTILVFTDANSMFRADALTKLLSHFDDDKIGGVCGRLVFLPPPAEGGNAELASPESSYWGWETRLKMAESKLDSCLGANGAIYAIRAEMFWDEIPANTLIDDFVLGMKVREQGMRLVYEPNAIAEEVLPEQSAEWNRRVRIGAGAYQSLGYCGCCLLPHYGKFAWMFWAHKVLRWFTPHILLLLLGCLVYWLLVCGSECRVLFGFWGGLLVLVMAVFIIISLRVIKIKDLWLTQLLLLLSRFFVMQAALFVGFVRYCRGGLQGHWNRTPR